MIASSSANVEAPPTAGVQLTEGPLAAEVPAGVHPGALSSNAGRAGVGDTNTAAVRDTNGAAGDTNGAACALWELLAVKLGIRAAPVGHPQSTSSAHESR